MRRPFGFFLVSGVAAMLAALVVYSALKQREAAIQRAMVQNVQILVAAKDLRLGAKIEPGSVKMVRWSREALPPGALSSPDSVIGSFVKASFVTNEPIVADKLFMGEKNAGIMPMLIPPGMRAMSVAVDEVSDIAGFIFPHSRVDVLVAVNNQNEGSNSDSPESKAFSKVVLQNVEVLAVAQEVEGKKDEAQVVRVVTLVVSPDEAERLALASHQGSLRLVMRNYNDNKIVLTPGSNMSDMLHAYSSRVAPPTMMSQAPLHVAAARRPGFEIEIHRDGKRSESLSFIDASLRPKIRAIRPAEPPSSAEPPAAGDGADEESKPADTASLAAPLPTINTAHAPIDPAPAEDTKPVTAVKLTPKTIVVP
jgi:pilus assembly protein CpaB